jgi:hypothetical protein
MTQVAVCNALYERRTLSGTCSLARSKNGTVDSADILSVDRYGGHPKALGASNDGTSTGHIGRFSFNGVLVILAENDQRKLPNRSHVYRLPYSARVDASIAEEAKDDLACAAELRGESRAHADSDTRAYDPVAAEIALVEVRNMHGATSAPIRSSSASIKLSHHRVQIDTLGYRVVMWSMAANNDVFCSESTDRSYGDGFLSDRGVYSTRNLASEAKRIERLLELPDRDQSVEPLD